MQKPRVEIDGRKRKRRRKKEENNFQRPGIFMIAGEKISEAWKLKTKKQKISET
ncbi:MAG: hypothetical protein LBO05_09510 [Deltaproteobacteria bacterium]|jgi:hypothetical protein|nr:hypothetical protein [Deltaproteobacteria bacterium]